MEISKESIVEYIEDMYALGINYLSNHNNRELKGLLNNLELLEDDIRVCDDMEILKEYVGLFREYVDKIEGIINE